MRLQGNQDLTWKKVWFNDGALEGKSCLRNRLKISFGIHWVCYVIFGKNDPTKEITFPTLTPTKYFLDPQLQDIGDHLFCTLISENQGLEKLRSVLNLKKISVPVHLIFFSRPDPDFFFSLSAGFFSDLYHKPEKFPGDKLKKKLRFAGPEIFLRFETDLNLSRPWFSEIKVQMKWPTDPLWQIWRNNYLNSKHM